MGRILVVESDWILRKNILTLLESENYKTLEAATSEGAVLILRSIKPDLIISGLLFPSIEGYELMKFTRSSPVLSSVPFIILTDKESCSNQNKNGTAGDIYLTKPFGWEILISSVKSLLEKKKKS
jgi:DNA-binding response OmpR family regulator